MFGQNVFHYRDPDGPLSHLNQGFKRMVAAIDLERMRCHFGDALPSLGSGAHSLQGQRHPSGREGTGPLPVAREPAWTGPPGGICVGGVELERCPELCPRLHRTLWSQSTCIELFGREPCPWTLSGRSHNPSVAGSNPARPMKAPQSGAFCCTRRLPERSPQESAGRKSRACVRLRQLGTEGRFCLSRAVARRCAGGGRRVLAPI
jgi:hypothetical protein